MPPKNKPQPAHPIINFFESQIHHTKGEWAGQKFTLAPWQKNFLQKVFGTMVPKKNVRQYRTAYLEVPRKNGKSSLAAGIALYLLMLDKEDGAEIFSAAADKEQASIVFNQAAEMVAANPLLKNNLQVFKNKTIYKASTNSFYRAVSSEAFTKHGINAHGIIFDEVHAQKDRELWDVLTTSTGARRQPLTVAITTAGWDRQSLCWELRQYAEQIKSGIIVDTSFFGEIWTSAGDWKLESTWREANPNYDVTVKRDYFSRFVAEAQANAARENVFRNLHLNQWTQQESRWMSQENWDACERELPDLSGRRCFGGLDLSSTLDLTAFVLLFPPLTPEEPYWVLPFCFAPEDAGKERERTNRQRLDTWARDGLLITTPGRVIDYGVVKNTIAALAEKYSIQEIAVDRWNINQVVKELEKIGADHGRADWLVGFGQGFAAMTAPIREMEGLIISKRIAHDGHPILRWMFGNLQVDRDSAGNMRFSKAKSTEKIDAMVALTMALGRAMVVPATAACVYDGRGVEAF